MAKRLTAKERLEKREERYARAIQLVAEGRASSTTAKCVKLIQKGLILEEIAAELGLNRSTVGAALADPERIKDAKRKQKRYGHCEGCGRKTFNAGSTPPRFCQRCQGRGYAKWSPELLIQRIQEWAERYGRPPSVLDWSPSHCRLAPTLSRERAERYIQRYTEGDWPEERVLAYYFGNHTAALKAAGFKPNPPGPRGDDG